MGKVHVGKQQIVSTASKKKMTFSRVQSTSRYRRSHEDPLAYGPLLAQIWVSAA